MQKNLLLFSSWICMSLQTAPHIRFTSAHSQRQISQSNHYLLCKQGPVVTQTSVKDGQLYHTEITDNPGFDFILFETLARFMPATVIRSVHSHKSRL